MARVALLVVGLALSVSAQYGVPKPLNQPGGTLPPAQAGSEQWLLKPTVFPASRFDARADADLLHEAFKGPLANESVIVSILPHRSLAQRLVIADKYKKYHGKDLREELKEELSGHMEDISKGMVTPLPIQYSKFLKDAMEGPGTTEAELTEILCGNDNAMIRDIVQSYTERYGKRLQADLESETSGALERLLVLLVQANRDESYLVNNQKVSDDVVALYNGGKVNWHDDPARLNQVLALRSFPHIRRVFLELSRKTGKDIKDLVEEQFSSGTEDGYVACVRVIQDPQKYFAKVLNKAMEGLGTNDKTLIRVALTRSEIDLGNIKEAYQQKYQRSVIKDIQEETSGSYRNMLTAIFE
ncbi:annexin B9-like [Cloeon dipterum]|uniref:annexin B9-like n=1 Tax=Cloeon dipterum TaxID=197152 RepID=UPI0032207259